MKIESRIGSSVFSFFMSIYFFDKDGWMLLWNLCAQLYRNSPKLSDMMKLPIFKHKVQDVDFTTSLSHNVSMLSSSLQTNRKIRFMRTRCQISTSSSVLKHIRYKQVQWWQNLLYHPMFSRFRYILKFA